MPDPSPTAPVAPSPTDELVSKLAAEIRRTPVAAASPTPATPSRDEILKRLDEAAKGGASKFTEELGASVLGPMQAGNIRAAAQINRRMSERDAEIGPLYRRYRDKAESRARELGGDPYIAEHGMDAVIRQVASEDPAYIDEIAEARATEKIAKRDAEAEAARKKAEAEAAAATPARRPATETVHTGVVASPAASEPTEEEEIRRVEVSEEETSLARTLFNMTPTDLKRQRYEIAKMQRRYGPVGIAQLGGIPICSLGDMRTGNGARYPSEED